MFHFHTRLFFSLLGLSIICLDFSIHSCCVLLLGDREGLYQFCSKETEPQKIRNLGEIAKLGSDKQGFGSRAKTPRVTLFPFC